jgi:putative flippase GtrA
MPFLSEITLPRLLKGSTDNTGIQFMRYTLVGGCAFIVDFSCLFVLTSYCHVHYLVSAAFAFVLGLVVNYVLSIRWVFNERRMRSMWVEFSLFAAIGLGGLLLNELFIWFFTEVVLFYYLISKAVSTVLVYIYNFGVRKLTLFS